MVCAGLRSMFEEFFIKIPSYARSNKLRSVLSNEWLANLKKNYLTSGFFGTQFLCHQRNGVRKNKVNTTGSDNNIYENYQNYSLGILAQQKQLWFQGYLNSLPSIVKCNSFINLANIHSMRN